MWARECKTYTASGTDSLFIPNGPCTDTVVLHVTIGQPVTSEFTASGCANYTLPWGTVVTASEIGRASCRERVESEYADRELIKKHRDRRNDREPSSYSHR